MQGNRKGSSNAVAPCSERVLPTNPKTHVIDAATTLMLFPSAQLGFTVLPLSNRFPSSAFLGGRSWCFVQGNPTRTCPAVLLRRAPVRGFRLLHPTHYFTPFLLFLCIYVSVCLCICASVGLCGCVAVCLCVCVSRGCTARRMCTRTHAHTHARTHTHTHTHTQTQTQLSPSLPPSLSLARTHTHIHVYI